MWKQQDYKEDGTMNKTKLLVLSAAAVISLAACGSSGTPDREEQRHIEKVDRTETYEAESLNVDNHVIIAYEDESLDEGHQIKSHTLPIKAYDAELVYSSKNPEIASISNTGLVRGVANGSTTVTIAPKDKPEAAVEVPVIVLKDGSTDEVKTKLNEQKEIQKERFIETVDEDGETVYKASRFSNSRHTDSYYYYIEDPTLPKAKQTWKLIRGDEENELTQGDEDEGYYGLRAKNYSLKVEDGNFDFVNYAWLFNTDDSYETYIYHEMGSIRNVLSVPTQAYIGQDRLAPAYDAMGLMFTNLREIAEDNFLGACETESLGDVENYSSLITRVGYNDEGYVSYRLEQLNYSGSDAVIKPENESTMEIPANTKYVGDVVIEYVWKDGVAVAFNYDYTMTYIDERDPYYIEPDGSIRKDSKGNPIDKKYIRTMVINQYTLAGDDFEINLPSPKDYNPVAELWDL